MENIDIKKENLYDAACSLYDGGWRFDDWKQLNSEYDLTDEELIIICDWLKQIEEWGN